MPVVISHADVLARAEADDETLPLLTIDEFFAGNTDEESLAPNQWGYGRPALSEIERRLRELAEEPGVSWVRVQLHGDTHALDGIVAEAIAICTDKEAGEVAELLDTESLQADGVIDGYATEDTGDEPEIPAGNRVISVVWD
ncbi:hypothetical protein SAMN05421805_104284 [Saccharopolyspora antimicrobica]|uniref:Uncharacterized protein n=1 Tax=Saccharopolyspora antimicrobica TaxID=455193 RepID=A0A1I4YUA4_9PSEU|nr:hypothetical protein ATL45_1068 [Saccharopolyspora antimicrobica]SFN41343.1 hypothetical protein SAMN05421805_104284 [Saccharopolyspora antimicrobica]